MLVIQRLKNEKVIIVVPPSTEPQRIEVMLVDVMGKNKARLGFTAGLFVTIHRDEIQREIDRENSPALTSK